MAKIKSLTVRPCKSADLSFPVQGIIEDFANSLYLGAQLEKFDLSDYIDGLHEFNEDGTPRINLAQLIEDLKKTFVFKENQFAGVFVYNYESEATSTEIKMTATV